MAVKNPFFGAHPAVIVETPHTQSLTVILPFDVLRARIEAKSVDRPHRRPRMDKQGGGAG
jgi:hypothetical protein